MKEISESFLYLPLFPLQPLRRSHQVQLTTYTNRLNWPFLNETDLKEFVNICKMIRPKRVKKRPLKLKDEDSEIQYEFNEIEDLLQKLRLTYVFIEGYVVFMRSDFDLNVAGEPYIAVTLLLDRTSGRFLARIWNRDIIFSARQIYRNFSFSFFIQFLGTWL